MKNLILVLALLMSFNLYSQETHEKESTLISDLKFNCDELKTDPTTKEMILKGNVRVKINLLTIAIAEKVTINKETDEIYAEGVERFSFQGELIINELITSKSIRYKIGGQEAYLE